jgi:DNA-binding NarL/FixJ family response regulator
MELKKKKVFIIDDHEIVRYGLTQLINNEENITVCGEAEGESEAMEYIKQLEPDLLIVDISLDGIDGIELIKNIRLNFKTPILCLSMHDEKLFAERALRAGANGYLMKEHGTKNIVTAINKIMNGEIYLSHEMTTFLLKKSIQGYKTNDHSAINELTDRERGVFSLIGRGYTTKEIADLLHLSIKTIESHKERIKKKLKLKNALELAQHAIQWGLNEKTVNNT